MIGEGLLSYFTRVIIDDLVKSGLPFIVDFDEPTTKQDRKASGSHTEVIVPNT